MLFFTQFHVFNVYIQRLGIAFDPMENDISTPKMYISHSFFFHKEPNSSSGLSINGKISRVFGPNLDQIEDVITGLPVSDHDHGINAIEFGNNGELYISVGSNTNGGKAGMMSTTLTLKENYLSSSIVVAYLQDPNFSGTIRYSQDDDGDLIANGIEVFAHGVRNAFGMIMHSNGNLYATDNGANVGYGNMLTGCGPNDFMMDKTDKDKLYLVTKGAYFGHPNPKRAAFLNEPRQCVWHPATDTSTSEYTAPIAILESSVNGIIDYHANYFDGQLRDNLIVSKYGDGLSK
jgi:glucose/arabinose dehydrogenase